MTVPASNGPPVIRRLGLVDYEETWRAMQRFVAQRGAGTPDEIWLLQHPPVYTRGLNSRMAPRRPSDVPVVQTDRGGQITYHGPGQVVAYVLLDVRRRGVGVKRLVSLLEQSVIDLLAAHGVTGQRRDGAPGVYVAERKIAALGIRIRRGCSYHGLSLNVDMDLGPYADIDPCGYEGMPVTQLADLGVQASVARVEDELAGVLAGLLAAAQRRSETRQPGSEPA